MKKTIKPSDNHDDVRKKISDLIEKERERVIENENEDYVKELQVNRQKEPRCRVLIYEKIQGVEDHMWPETDLINSCAEELGISPTTARKYLNKLCSSSGVLKRVVNDNIRYITFKLEKLL